MNNIQHHHNGEILAAIAEDHRMMRDGVIHFLEKTGGIRFIIRASNGLELINAISIADPKPKVCLLDLSMPVMDGFEAISIIRKRWPFIKTVVLTSYMDEMYIVRAISLGAKGYISKNANPMDTKEALVTVCNGGYYIRNVLDEFLSLGRIMDESPLPELTAREVQLLELSNRELTWSEIAQHLKTTQKSVEGSRDILYRKLNVKTKVGLLLAAIKLGVIKPDSPGISMI